MTAAIVFEAAGHLFSSPSLLVALIASVAAGLFLGSLPGLGVVFALSIALPLTISLGSQMALTIMVGVYVSAVYGGAITSILFRVPGHPGNIATTFDGYPMAQNGQAGRALVATAVSGSIGGLLSLCVVFLIGHEISQVALKVQPADYFMLVVLGICFVAVVSHGDVIQGLILGFLGAALATVGLDPINGAYRLTYGSQFLKLNGFNLEAVTIGVFAFGSALYMLEQSTHVNRPPTRKVESLSLPTLGRQAAAGAADVAKHPLPILRGSVTGMLCGLIPGLGIVMSNVLAYSFEKSITPDKPWGRGYVVGAMVPEVADNGTIVTELIPAFALGIPGAVTSALMLAALNAHGLFATPSFYSKLTVTTSGIFVAMGVAFVLVATLGILLAPVIARASTIPWQALSVVIFVLGTMGAFIARGQYGDMVVAGAFGVVGYIILKLHFPLAPLVLGQLLGPLAEGNYRRAMTIAKATGQSPFLTPAPLAIGGIAALALVGSLLYSRRSTRRGDGSPTESPLGRPTAVSDLGASDRAGSNGEGPAKEAIPRSQDNW